MNKLIIGVVAAAVVIGAAGTYFVVSQKDDSGNQSIVDKSDSNGKIMNEQASIEDLLTRNSSMKCTYDVDDNGSKNIGTAYFSGGKKMYGKFVSTSEGTTNSALVIRDGDTQYFWMKGANTGFKANFAASKEDQEQKTQQFDPDKKYQFTCEKWQKDESKFVPPSTVTFTDIAEQTRLIQEQINRGMGQ